MASAETIAANAREVEVEEAVKSLPDGVTLEKAFQHERRRAQLLENIVVEQLASIGLALETLNKRVVKLESATSPLRIIR